MATDPKALESIRAPGGRLRDLTSLRVFARLVNRRARRLYITEAGQRRCRQCVRVVSELDQARSCATPR
jgi:DNA-binding transcriptional LysR family regulator